MSPKTASQIPFRGIGLEIHFAHLPITEGDLPEDCVGSSPAQSAHGLSCYCLCSLRSTVPWESTFALVHCGKPWEKDNSQSVRMKGLEATFTSFLVYVIFCKNIWNLKQVRSVLALNYVRTNIQFKRIAGFILIAEKPGDICSLFWLSIYDL